jgi:SAM-dependent methyltransferase
MQRQEYRKEFQIEKYHWWFKAKKLFVGRTLKKYLKKKKYKILDAGCGVGTMSDLLSEFGQVISMDKHPSAIFYAGKKGLKVTKGSVNKMPFKKSSFDMVAFFDVLYHRDVNDSQALKQAYEVLKDDGILIVTDSGSNILSRRHDEVMHARQRYSLSEMEEKVKKAGFEIIKKSYIFCFTYPLFLIAKLADSLGKKDHSRTQINPWINNLLFHVCRFEANILEFINLPFGSSVLVLARKKQK